MKLKNLLMSGVLASTTTLLPLSAIAEEASYFTFSTGLDYSTGTYGTATPSDTVSVPISGLYENGSWSFKMIIPYMQVTGEGSAVVSSSSRGRRASTTTTTTTTTTKTTFSGLGDVVALVIYNAYSNDNFSAGVDLTGRVKFGTASKQLGSGENDYAAQLNAYHDIGNFSPSMMVGYEVVGSSPELPTNNVYYGSVGISYRFSDATRTGIDYKAAQKASATGYEQREAILYVSTQVGDGSYLRGYLLKGYSEGSPSSGGGLSISTEF